MSCSRPATSQCVCTHPSVQSGRFMMSTANQLALCRSRRVWQGYWRILSARCGATGGQQPRLAECFAMRQRPYTADGANGSRGTNRQAAEVAPQFAPASVDINLSVCQTQILTASARVRGCLRHVGESSILKCSTPPIGSLWAHCHDPWRWLGKLFAFGEETAVKSAHPKGL